MIYRMLKVPSPIIAPQKIWPITCSMVIPLTRNGFPITKVCSLSGNNPPIIEWFEGQFESGQTDINHSIINHLKEAYNNVNNSNPIIEGVTYGSDLRLFTNHADIPALLFGPGDVRLAHSANEYVEIEEVLTCIKIISNLIINWCGE